MKVRKAVITNLMKKGIDPQVSSCYLAARFMGADMTFFTQHVPLNYRTLMNKIPLGVIVGIKVHPSKVKEWALKWPKPVATVHWGYAVSGNGPDCIKRFSQFFLQINDRFEDIEEFQDLDEDSWWKLINDATDRYLEHQETQNWEFTKKNFKFVLDENGSVLETWIRLGIEDGTYENFQL